jgi:alpha-mannosidase
MMEEVPEFTFVQSQLALCEAMKQHYPDLFQRGWRTGTTWLQARCRGPMAAKWALPGCGCRVY